LSNDGGRQVIKPATDESDTVARAQSIGGDEPQRIAIVGMSGRYAGADDLQDYWHNLSCGASTIRSLPARRVEHFERDGEMPVGGYLDDISTFDSLLFRINPAEARALDPQERLLLESAWACLDDAGYTSESLSRRARVGVFIGAMWNDYQSVGVELWRASGSVTEFSQHASIANRISHWFNFTGPSVAMNTACSSAMTALHFACESLARGDCDAALVGGVNLICMPIMRDC